MSKSKNREEVDKYANKTRDAIGFISLGLVLMLLAILMSSKDSISIKPIILELLSHIGIGLLVIGILAILIDLSHWTYYFEKRLSNIVMDKKYLKTLDKNSLISLQTEVLKAYFNNDDIGGTDGFLHYYQRNIQTLISSPFRTNVNLHYLIDYLPSDKTKLLVTETMSWRCKSNGGKIQNSVKWIPSEYEVEKLNDFIIILQHDSFKSKENEKGEKIFTPGESGSTIFTNDKNGFILSLESFIDLDNLRVKICVNYIIPQERIISKRMAYPTRGINLSVQYPKELDIATEPYYNENTMTVTNNPGSYHLSSEDWIMPDEGLTLQLLKNKKHTS